MILGVLGSLSLVALVVVILVPWMRWRWRRRLLLEGCSDVESGRASSRRTHTRIISAQDASLPLLTEQAPGVTSPEMASAAVGDGLTASVVQKTQSSWPTDWKILSKLPSFSSESLSSLGRPLDNAEKWNAEEEFNAYFREKEKEMASMDGASVTILNASQTSLPTRLRTPPLLIQDKTPRRVRVDSDKAIGSARATPTASETLHSLEPTSKASTPIAASSNPPNSTPILSLSPLVESFNDTEPNNENSTASGTSGSTNIRSKSTSEKTERLPTASVIRRNTVASPVNVSRSPSTLRPRESWLSNMLASNFFAARSPMITRDPSSRRRPARMPSIPESLRPSQVSHSPPPPLNFQEFRDSGVHEVSEFGEIPSFAHYSQHSFGITRNSSEFSRRPMSDATLGTFGRQPSSGSGTSYNRAASRASSSYPPELQAHVFTHYRNLSNTTEGTHISTQHSHSGTDSNANSQQGRRSNEASESSQRSGGSVGCLPKAKRHSYAREPSPPPPTMPLSVPPSLKPPLPPKSRGFTSETSKCQTTVNDVGGVELTLPQLPLRPISPFNIDSFPFRITPPGSAHGHPKSRSGSARSNASRKQSVGRSTPPMFSSKPKLPDEDSVPLLGEVETTELSSGTTAPPRREPEAEHLEAQS